MSSIVQGLDHEFQLISSIFAFCSTIDGPSVSPSIFVSIIQTILEDRIPNVMIYLDDIIISICYYGKTE